MKTVNLLRPVSLAATLLIAGLLTSACSDVGYRCPLDPSKKPDSPTACAGMSEALAGAQHGTGGKLSVLLDDKGRLVPTDMHDNRPAQPLLMQTGAGVEPYPPSTGEPVFRQSKVYKVEASSFVDANGNLHDAHNAWFATPGRWSYGTVDQGGAGSDNLLKPASPLDYPGKVVQTAGPGVRSAAKTPTGPVFGQTQKQRDDAALKNLSAVAQSAAKSATASQQQGLRPAQAAAGVTAPAISLGN